MASALKEYELLIDERIKEVEANAATAYAQQRQEDIDKLHSTFEGYKARNEKALKEYEKKCHAYRRQLAELSLKYEQLKAESESMNESFRALHVKLVEQMDQATGKLAGFRQIMLAAWQKEKQVLLSDLKEGWQKDKEEAVIFTREAEHERVEAEARVAAYARELGQRQQEWNQRVSELESRQSQVLKTMSKYWTVFQTWLRQNVKMESELGSPLHGGSHVDAFETSARQLDLFLRKFQSDHPHLLQQVLVKYSVKRDFALPMHPTHLQKTTACRFWLQGQCKYGASCSFYHDRNL